MKRTLFLLLFVSVLFFNKLAAQSTITVFSENGEKFWVILNGNKQNPMPQTNVFVDNLTLERYKIKIIFEDENLKSIDDNIYTKTFKEGFQAGDDMNDDSMGPSDATYVVMKKKDRYILRLNNMEPAKPKATKTENKTKEQPIQQQNDIIAPAPVNTQVTTVTTTTTTNNKPTQPKTVPGVNMNVTVGADGQNASMNVSVNADMMNVDMNVQDSSQTTTKTTTTKTTTIKRTDKPVVHQYKPQPKPEVKPNDAPPAPPAPPAQQGCVTAMSASDFNNAKESVKKQSFAESKMKVAKQFTKNNCLSVTQIKEVIALFSFENDKLEFAKFAYDFTVDKKNYYLLNDAFSFSSSVDELNEFLELK